MAALFGTDGVRGLANEHLTPELALQLAQAAAVVLSESAVGRPVAVVGRDTRISGQMLEAAMVAGLTSVGVDVQLVGILPTPAIAFLTDFLGADLGVVISASHNQMPDNGIKFLARGGEKLADETEIAIAAHLGGDFDRPVGAALGAVETYQGSDYQQHLLSVLQHKLTGLKVVLDCAHGAASQVGPEVFQAAGAEVVVINADPDGLNINLNCGSTHLEGLQAAVVAEKADLGFGFDGDADRCLAVAADGEIVDGDQILAILALGMQRADQLKQQTVVATVMSNLGFKIAMEAAGVKLRETQVGDRYVLAEMQANGFNLGGEQSGHVIVSDHATTGDGVLTALLVAEQVITQQKSLLELAAVMTKLPQVLINVPEVDKSRVNDPIVQTEVAAATAELGNRGRVLLRASGTENLVRVMVEAATENQAQEIAQHLAEVIRVQLG